MYFVIIHFFKMIEVAVSFRSCNSHLDFYKHIGKKEDLIKILENEELIKIITMQNEVGFIYFEKGKDPKIVFFEFEKLSKKLGLCFLHDEIIKVGLHFYDLSIFPTCTVGGDENWT